MASKINQSTVASQACGGKNLQPGHRKYSKPCLRTLGSNPRDTLSYVQISIDWAL